MPVRKLGVVTGILMVILLVFGGIGPLDFFITKIPIDFTNPMVFYTWGYWDGIQYINMFTLTWPNCVFTWLTSITFMASVGLTIGASTPGSLPENAKRMFAISAIFCLAHALFYLFMLMFSSFVSIFYLFLGPGFYGLILFFIFNLISAVKAE